MHTFLWILQFILGLYFLSTGAIHFILPEGLPSPMSWMYELSPLLHWVSGIAEILGGLGLILPGLLKIRPELTRFAALGLVFVMVGAASWHLYRGEYVNIAQNAILAILVGFLAYGRSKLVPLTN